MGLYDNVKQHNGTYISQYVGNVVPELKEFSLTLQKRYNEAKDTDDALLEAMGNLQHLGTEEDTTYANELKQTYLNRMNERAEQGDYENMGRRVQRDARQFGSDYSPLINRLKGMQAIQERVLQDKDIFSPETKQRILGKIQHQNRAARDGRGEFIRDASGKIQLGAISDWAYAKDVDIDKKNAEILDKLQAEEHQSGYTTSSDGKLLTSTTTTKRSKTDLARLARERMENDPEVKAMIERDVELATYNMTPKQFRRQAEEDNISIYDDLKRSGNSEQQIRAYAKAHDMTYEQTKAKPIDKLREKYEAAGRSPVEADMDYVRNKVRRSIVEPHVAFIADLLKINKTSMDAKVDPDYAARATAAATMAASGGEASMIEVNADAGNIESVDIEKLSSEYADSSEKLGEAADYLRASVASYMGLGKPNPNTNSEYYNKTSKIINNPAEQGKAIQALVAQGKQKEANDLSVAFRSYNNMNNRMIVAKSQIDALASQVDFKPIYEEYKKNNDKPLGYAQFIKEVMKPTALESASILSKDDYKTKGSSLLSDFTNIVFNNPRESAKLKAARSQVFSKAKELSKNVTNQNTVFEPTSDGFIARETKSIEDGVKNGMYTGTVMGTGKTLKDLLYELGDEPSEEAKADPRSKYNNFLDMVKIRVNTSMKGIGGVVTGTVFTPKGNYTVTLDNVRKTLPTEMGARLLTTAGKSMTKNEATYKAQQIVKGAGATAITHFTEAQLATLGPAAQPYQLNDIFYMKVQNAGVKGVDQRPVYSLYVKNSKGLVPVKELQYRDSVDDIKQALGRLNVEEQMQANPTTDLLR